MARWKDVPDDAWQRIFGLLGYLDLARCLAVCRDWRRLGALPLLPSVLIPSAEQGLSSSFDISLREMGLLENAPGFHGRRVIGSFVGGRLAIAFTVANPTLYGVVDLSTGEVTQSLPDRLRIPNSAHLQSVAIMAITGGSGGVFAAIASGETNLIFWRVGMEAWCPPLAPEPVPLPGLDDDAHRFWRMILPACAIDDVHYSDASDVFFVLTIRQDLWRYVPLRLQDGGLAFQRHLDIVGDDFSGVMAARYLFAGPDEALLMARRVLSPQHEEEGTSELEVFISLVPTAAQGSPEPDGAAERWTSWRRLTQPTGLLVFLGRGNSKAYRSLATKPSSIFFLDDRDSYRHLCPTYRCVDSGRLSPPPFPLPAAAGNHRQAPVPTGFSPRASNNTTPQPPPPSSSSSSAARWAAWIPRAAVGGVSPEQVLRLIRGAVPASSLTHPAQSSAPSTPASTWRGSWSLLSYQPSQPGQISICGLVWFGSRPCSSFSVGTVKLCLEGPGTICRHQMCAGLCFKTQGIRVRLDRRGNSDMNDDW